MKRTQPPTQDTKELSPRGGKWPGLYFHFPTRLHAVHRSICLCLHVKSATDGGDIQPGVSSLCAWYSLYAMAQFVEALRYKPECRDFDSRWGL